MPNRTTTVNGRRKCADCKKRRLLKHFYQFKNGYYSSYCRPCAQVRQRHYAERENPAVRAKRQKLADQACRRRVIDHYGGCCACCGEDAIEFMAIDHIDGGGNEHRREINCGGKFYRWLESHGYPDGYRILCHNCNHSLGTQGYCPHQGLRLAGSF